MPRLEEVGFLAGCVTEQLGQLDIISTHDLLRRGATPEGRREIARICGADVEQVSSWVHTCDLLRIKGLSETFIGLVSAAGAPTLADLAVYEPAELRARMALVNAEHSFVGILPSEDLVNDWIAQASELEPGLRDA
jgi:hypothetical protein